MAARDNPTSPEIPDATLRSAIAHFDWKAVALIGEFTTSEGPYADDHFLVFVLRNGEWLEVPVSKASWCTPQLGPEFQGQLGFQLNSVTKEASRIMYPTELADRALFKFSHPKTKGWLGRLKAWFTIERQLSDEVREFLSRSSR